ncbi:PQQ-binding-like beta-propeller repeat protein [Kitasatospora sp. NPDC088391]|uniref:outer membrane protein assembly factor BamB family protein n=1 Tax=Kitasatospora sp. NPDC088391 TaxID=3364074 RepID=UPI0037FE446F
MVVVELWERVLHQRGAHSRLCVAGGRVLVHERHSRLVCLDAADGSPGWDVPLGTWPRALVVAGDRVLALPQDRPVLSCFALGSGALLWQAELARGSGHVTVVDGVVLTGGWRGYTAPAAFALADGRPLWRAPAPVRTELPAAWAGGLLLGDGTRAWLLDPRTGRETASWRLPLPLAGADSGTVFTVLDEDRCAVVCGSRSVVVLSRTGRAVEVLRPQRNALLGGAPLRADGLLWLRERRCGGGGGWVGVDPLDGTPRQRVAVRERPVTAGVVGTPTGVAVALEDGALLRVPGPELPGGTGGTGGTGNRERIGHRVAAVHALGPGRLLAVTRNSLRAWQL